MRDKAGRSIVQPGFSENLTLRNKELIDLFECREITMKIKCKEEVKERQYVEGKKIGVRFQILINYIFNFSIVGVLC